MGRCAETLQGTPCATGLPRSVLFECLAMLVPNKERIGGSQEAEPREVEDECLSCKFAGPFSKEKHKSCPGEEKEC